MRALGSDFSFDYQKLEMVDKKDWIRAPNDVQLKANIQRCTTTRRALFAVDRKMSQ